jgi:NADH-quinone oxidoreductase subunit M
MITGIFRISGWYALAGGTTMVLSAIYMLYAYQRVMLGEEKVYLKKITDIALVDYLMLVPLILVILGLGIFPQPVFNLVEQSILIIQNLCR